MKNQTNQNKKDNKCVNQRKQLKRAKICLPLVVIGACGAAACEIVDLCMPGYSGVVWHSYLLLTLCAFIAVCSLVLMYAYTHYRGEYRCKICGHIHTPDEDELIDALLDSKKGGKLHCPNCDSDTKHKKVSRRNQKKSAV